MRTHFPDQDKTNISNVVSLLTGKPVTPIKNYIHIAPETHGLEILYSNIGNHSKLYSLKVAFWAITDTGEICAMIPWLNQVISAHDINDPLHGKFEGYRDPFTGSIFDQPPPPKILELETNARYYEPQVHSLEIPDSIGTHIVVMNEEASSFHLIEVFSWRLNADGDISAMLVDEKLLDQTPVLPGDSCLYSADDEEKPYYFFQHGIANRIKQRDPSALDALNLLVNSTLH